MITNTHLKKAHGMTTEEYLQLPGAVLTDEFMKACYRGTRYKVERPICALPGCENQTTESHNKYCSTSCRSKAYQRSKPQDGEANPFWKGGWYSIGKAQKRLARKRDGYQCRCCQKPVEGKGAHVHHIKAERCFDTPEEAHDLENLVTLCSKCHLRVEWKMLRELHRRAELLDELMKNSPEFQTFEDFKKSMVTNACN
jgi:5-methylcytosine-specific restriction endonuclease McrA